MNLFETNCITQSQPKPAPPIQNVKNTYFLTTNQPLAVQENTRNVKLGCSTASRRVFGPNDMVVMTTWVEKYTFSTVKTTTVGKPVVSDSVQIPSELVTVGCCQPSKGFPQRQPSAESSIPCPIPGSCVNPGCQQEPQTCSSSSQPSNSGSQPCTSGSETTSSLVQAVSQLEDESEDLNEICTDSEDEQCTDSEDEESDCIDV